LTLQVLSAEVASYLGLELGKIKIKRFADGEIYVQVQVRAGRCECHFSC
jgi:ribose-phosphate pyrophosphokinase